MKRTMFICIAFYLSLFFVSSISAETPSTTQYKVGVGDVIAIQVLDHPELSKTVKVGEDGLISYPYIGSLHAKGMTLTGIQDEITKRLSEGYIKYPVVTASLYQAVIKKIFTYGEFFNRGAVAYEDNMTLLSAMSLAGGVSNDGLFGMLEVKRRQKKNIKYDVILKAHLKNGHLLDKKNENMLLQPDDILVVERNKTFLIQGEVGNRGRFVLEKDMTVLNALLQIGGVREDGMYGRIKVRRKQEGTAGGYKDVGESKINEGVIESKDIEDMLLQPDDILTVERNKTFLIQGEVAQRGRLVLEKDMTVLQALLQSGGVTGEGLYGWIKVRRQEGAAGGYKDVGESKINEGVIESKEIEDMLLQPDDILVAGRNKTYFVYGEVNRTGEYVLKEDMTVFKALIISGGFTKWGSGSRVKVLRVRKDSSEFETIKVNIKDVIDGESEEDIFLKESDTIVVSTGVF